MTHAKFLLLAAALTAAATAQQDSELAAPVLLTADGAAIDVGSDIGHAGPQMRDVDGDGLDDLLVSAFRGNIRWFRNTGSAREPAFAAGGLLEAGGEPIRLHNW